MTTRKTFVRRAFTLIELLVVIAIIAILAAILFPVFVQVRAAAYQMVTVGYAKQMSEAALMYTSDSDETFMPAMGGDSLSWYAWFGRIDAKGKVDEASSLLAPYRGKKKIVDPTAHAKDYLGDHSGFGYNWGYVGSDMHVTGNYSEYPFCLRPARTSDIPKSSTTVLFATSVYFAAPWEAGDGSDYDFGFVDPIGSRPSNPNVDFRHITAKQADVAHKRLITKGNAVIAMADGRARSISREQLKDRWFTRDTGE